MWMPSSRVYTYLHVRWGMGIHLVLVLLINMTIFEFPLWFQLRNIVWSTFCTLGHPGVTRKMFSKLLCIGDTTRNGTHFLFFSCFVTFRIGEVHKHGTALDTLKAKRDPKDSTVPQWDSAGNAVEAQRTHDQCTNSYRWQSCVLLAVLWHTT